MSKKRKNLDEREKQIALKEEEIRRQELELKEQQAVIDAETKKLSIRESDEVTRVSETTLAWSFINPDNGNHLG